MTTRTRSIVLLAILEATPLTTPTVNRLKEHNEPFYIRGTVRVDHVKLCSHEIEVLPSLGPLKNPHLLGILILHIDTLQLAPVVEYHFKQT